MKQGCGIQEKIRARWSIERCLKLLFIDKRTPKYTGGTCHYLGWSKVEVRPLADKNGIDSKQNR